MPPPPSWLTHWWRHTARISPLSRRHAAASILRCGRPEGLRRLRPSEVTFTERGCGLWRRAKDAHGAQHAARAARTLCQADPPTMADEVDVQREEPISRHGGLN